MARNMHYRCVYGNISCKSWKPCARCVDNKRLANPEAFDTCGAVDPVGRMPKVCGRPPHTKSNIHRDILTGETWYTS